MIAVIFLFILAWNFYIGYTRGFVLQVYYSLGAVVAFICASLYYKRLADTLTLWLPYSSPAEDAKMAFFRDVNLFELDQVFYAGAAFVLIYASVYLLLRFVGIFFHLVETNRWNSPHYRLIAGVLEVVLTIFFASMCLTVLATIPMDLVQDKLGTNALVKILVNFPLISHLLRALWVTAIL